MLDERIAAQRSSQVSTSKTGGLWLCLVLAAVALLGQCLFEGMRWWHEHPRPGHQTPSRIDLRLDGGTHAKIGCFIFLPDGYSTHDRWPLILYLHGGGQCGNDLDLLLKWGLPSLIARGKNLPAIVVSPQSPPTTMWDSRLLLVLLDNLTQQYAVDPFRIYVLGESMGGFGTWRLICAAPDRFAAAVPVCGGGAPDQAQRLTALPIWAFHGEHDNTVPCEESMRMVDAVNTLGGHARLTILKNRGHSICNEVFSRDDLYDWLLCQKRQ